MLEKNPQKEPREDSNLLKMGSLINLIINLWWIKIQRGGDVVSIEIASQTNKNAEVKDTLSLKALVQAYYLWKNTFVTYKNEYTQSSFDGIRSFTNYVANLDSKNIANVKFKENLIAAKATIADFLNFVANFKEQLFLDFCKNQLTPLLTLLADAESKEEYFSLKEQLFLDFCDKNNFTSLQAFLTDAESKEKELQEEIRKQVNKKLKTDFGLNMDLLVNQTKAENIVRYLTNPQNPIEIINPDIDIFTFAQISRK